jgi:hypothetical protein
MGTVNIIKTMKNNIRLLAGIFAAIIFVALTLLSGYVPRKNRHHKSNPSHTIRPIHVRVSGTALTDMHLRILVTRWPDKKTVSNRPQCKTNLI